MEPVFLWDLGWAHSVDAAASESRGGPLLPQLPAAWHKKQKSRSKLKWSLKCPQNAGEGFWPGYGSFAQGRVSFFGKAKVSWNRSDQSICFFARKAKFKWDSLSAQFIYLGVALIILISLVSWEKCSWSYPLCQKYNLERVCENK